VCLAERLVEYSVLPKFQNHSTSVGLGLGCYTTAVS
jgi:hypothetical protein